MDAPQRDSACWSIPADLRRIQPLVMEAGAFLGQYALAGKLQSAAQLVLEEIVSNIVQHSFSGDSSQEVRVAITVEPEAVTITVEDEGRPFDPVADAPIVDTESPLEERRPGGMGLHLVRQLASGLQYARIGDTNRLSIRIESEH